jgi:hypothetical protein
MSDKVAKPEVMAAADSLEDLLHQTVTNLQRYGHSSEDLQGTGMFTGSAGSTNVLTAGEIQDAINKITTRWTTAIDLLRRSVGDYDSTDVQSASDIAAVASGMGGGDLRWT